MSETRFLYDDQGRLERSITVSPWTAEDRALMIAWESYKNSIDGRCQQPIDRAWHPKNDPIFYEVVPIVCHACTAKARVTNREADPVTHHVVRDVRDHDQHPLPPFDLSELFDDD